MFCVNEIYLAGVGFSHLSVFRSFAIGFYLLSGKYASKPAATDVEPHNQMHCIFVRVCFIHFFFVYSIFTIPISLSVQQKMM